MRNDWRRNGGRIGGRGVEVEGGVRQREDFFLYSDLMVKDMIERA